MAARAIAALVLVGLAVDPVAGHWGGSPSVGAASGWGGVARLTSEPLSSAAPLWRFAEQLDGASVRILRDDPTSADDPTDDRTPGLGAPARERRSTLDCPAQRPGFRPCAGSPGRVIMRGAATFRGLQLPCVWAPPPAEGALVMLLEGLPAAHQLLGFAGLPDGSRPGDPVDVRVLASGREAARLTLATDDGARLFTAHLRPEEGRRVRVEVRGGSGAPRSICLDLFGTTAP